MEKVSLERDERGVLTLTINREEKRNAVDYDVMQAFEEAIAQAETDDRVKMLAITGSGERAFCSGGDLSVFHELYTKEEAYGMLSKMGAILHKLYKLPKPTVAFVNGTALGGGCEILTACDFRIAKEGVSFGFVQGKLAITTGWGGATMLLERIAKHDAMRLLMTAERYKAEDGHAVKLFSEVFPKETFREDCQKWLDTFTAQDVTVLKAYKEASLRKLDLDKLYNDMFAEIERCSILWEADAHHDAVNAFLTK
ncbi:enoyl-CoA hydratase/isomerase family protein [Bacillus tianshenii]|nr:enoyl-CoA hydratase/isomerase family protein [Bacillus tianshenii]